MGVTRGPANPVKDGGPLATGGLDWQGRSLLFIRACMRVRSTIDAYGLVLDINDCVFVLHINDCVFVRVPLLVCLPVQVITEIVV